MNNIFLYDTPDWLQVVTLGRDVDMGEMGITPENLCMPHQTHSDHVLWTDKPGRPEDTDATITQQKGLWLCVRTADCIPILLYDDDTRTVAAVHSGWRGTVARIVCKTVEFMHSAPSHLHAIMGPGISLNAFEVGDEVYEQFREAGFPMSLVAERREKWHIDLFACNEWLLGQMGVGNVVKSGLCTYSHSEMFYSARHDGTKTGRNLNLIVLKDA